MSQNVASCSHNVAYATGSCSLHQEVKSTGPHFCFRLLAKHNRSAKYYSRIYQAMDNFTIDGKYLELFSQVIFVGIYQLPEIKCHVSKLEPAKDQKEARASV